MLLVFSFSLFVVFRSLLAREANEGENETAAEEEVITGEEETAAGEEEATTGEEETAAEEEEEITDVGEEETEEEGGTKEEETGTGEEEAKPGEEEEAREGTCSDFADVQTCIANGCAWTGTCTDPTCGQYRCDLCENEETCHSNNCLWIDGGCLSCMSYPDAESCNAVDECTWTSNDYFSMCINKPTCGAFSCDVCNNKETCTANNCIWTDLDDDDGTCAGCYSFRNETSCLSHGCSWAPNPFDNTTNLCVYEPPVPPACSSSHCDLCTDEASCPTSACVWDVSSNTCGPKPPPAACDADGVNCAQHVVNETACRANGCVWGAYACTPCCSFNSSTDCTLSKCAWNDTTNTCAPTLPDNGGGDGDGDGNDGEGKAKAKEKPVWFYPVVIAAPIAFVVIVAIIIVVCVVSQMKTGGYSDLSINKDGN